MLCENRGRKTVSPSSLSNLFSICLRLQRNMGIKYQLFLRMNNRKTIYIYFSVLPIVLYSCETWSLTLRDKCKLRLFENGILRRILVNIVRVIKSRRLRWTGHVARMEEDRTTFKIITGKRH